MAMRRNRVPLIILNYSIALIILIYLLVIGYQASKIELNNSRERESARKNGASDDEINQINAEQEEEMKPYDHRFKIVAAILIPVALFTIGLHNLGSITQIVVEVEHVEPIIAHSKPAPVPVAKLVEIHVDIDIEVGAINPGKIKNKS
jgi:hypothetical protein